MLAIAQKDPAFLFYTADFYFGTLDMTDEQVGQYIRLLCAQHLKGYLTKKLMLDKMRGNWDELIASKFKQGEDGNYFNERLISEIKNRSRFVDSRRSNGEKGGRPPAKKDSKQNQKETIWLDEDKTIRFDEGETIWLTYGEPYGDEMKCNEMNRNEIEMKVKKERKKSTESTDVREAAAKVIAHLNAAAGTNYMPDAKATITLVEARLADGYGVADFKTVIDKKCAEWLGGDMAKYIRPQTLFGSNFEGYLNQLSGQKSGKNIYADLAAEARAEEGANLGGGENDPERDRGDNGDDSGGASEVP